MKPIVITKETDPFCGTRISVRCGNDTCGRFKYNSSLDCYEGSMLHGNSLSFKNDNELLAKISDIKEFHRVQFEDKGIYLISLDYGKTWVNFYEVNEHKIKKYWPHILQSMKPNVMDNISNVVSKEAENWKIFLLAYLHRMGTLKVKPLEYYENR